MKDTDRLIFWMIWCTGWILLSSDGIAADTAGLGMVLIATVALFLDIVKREKNG